MKTETALPCNISIKVVENQIQLNERKVTLISKSEHSINGTIEFSGFTFGGIKVAILNWMNYNDETTGQQLITQATMLAWELEYELFISTQKISLLNCCGFHSFRNGTQEIYCTELTWNAFEKVNVLNLATLIQQRN